MKTVGTSVAILIRTEAVPTYQFARKLPADTVEAVTRPPKKGPGDVPGLCQ